MKICQNCGAQNFDIRSTCERCGAPITALQVPYYKQQGIKPEASRQNSGLTVAAKVFMVISTVSNAIAFLLFFIIWMIAVSAAKKNHDADIPAIIAFIYTIVFLIPFIVSLFMTMKYFTKVNGREDVSVAFKVCTLLFVNLVAGILMLCDNVQETNVPTEATSNENKMLIILEQHKDLLDRGLITQEEYDAKKKQILGL